MAAATVLKFKQVDFKGICEVFRPGPIRNLSIRSHFVGVEGSSEIDGGTIDRQLEFVVLLFDSYTTRQKLWDFLDTSVYPLQGVNGTLAYLDETNKFRPKFGDCTLDAAEILPPGMLEDVADTLDGGWFCTLHLTFTQMAAF